MKERPMLFSGPMVRAILAGNKTQTRRLVKPQPQCFIGSGLPGGWTPAVADGEGMRALKCPYGQPGDRLWVREAFCDDWKQSHGIVYRADGGLDADMFDAGCKWRPSIHMPRLASRITLEIVGVRVKRLQDISEDDTVAEGIPEGEVSPADAGRFAYRLLWESINGPGSWDANPWVWAIEFKRLGAAPEPRP